MLDCSLDPHCFRRKILRSLGLADLGAIRRIYLQARVCVSFDGRFARPEQENGAIGRGRRMKLRNRFTLCKTDQSAIRMIDGSRERHANGRSVFESNHPRTGTNRMTVRMHHDLAVGLSPPNGHPLPGSALRSNGTRGSKARRVRSLVIRDCADQPTTRRENRSMTTHRYSQPLWILI